MTSAICVVKIGGSLYDMPDLAGRLRAVLTPLQRQRVILFPGGGAMADGVRALDHGQNLGEEAAHWLALRALTVNAFFLQALLPEFPVAFWPAVPDRVILDPYSYALADETRPDHLPHTWEVTSDSLAVRAAHLLGAEKLLLLKSVSIKNGLSWTEAARAGFVDAYFTEALKQASGLEVRVINLRALGNTPSVGPCQRR
jgi:aspartokinase-like uncharacterized kinase